MKHLVIIVFTAVISMSLLRAQAISPPSSKNYPFQVGIIMDGGTIYILQKRTKTEAEQKYCINNQINSKTSGELYSGNLHPTLKGATLVPPDEARKILNRIEATLEKYHGKETLKRYRTKPIDFEAMTEKEADKKIKDPKFNDRLSTQILLKAIQQYRESHKAI